MAQQNQTPGIKIHTIPENSGAPVLQRIPSITLLKGARELVIEHAGEEYRLRLTSKGKLILTK